MEVIPPKGSPEREALIAEHLACVESMKGVAGFTVMRCATPGDTTDIYGGLREDSKLRRILIRMRGTSTKGKLVIVCTEVEKKWRVARLSGIRGVLPEYVDDRIFDNEQDAHHAVFLMRLDEFPADDGMPEHYTEGWKRRDDNAPVT